MKRKDPQTIEELFEHEIVHASYQRALCEDFSFLDNFMPKKEDNSDD
jgi:hypothetical protein